MSKRQSPAHRADVASIATTLEQEGWKVLREPSRATLSLGNYRPDIIATRGDEGLVVEVKTSERKIDVEQFAEIARAVSAHPGWRFILVPADTGSTSERVISGSLPSWKQIDARLLDLSEVHPSGNPAYLLGAWSLLESALRRLGEDHAVPIAQLSARAMIGHLYSLGLLTLQQHRLLVEAIPMRNAIAHGYLIESADAAAEAVLDVVGAIVSSRHSNTHAL